MDISKPITYRLLNVNSVALQTGRNLRGFAVESVDYSNVRAVGYTEQRAAADGLHASDVYLGGRQIDLNGMLYGSSLGDLFDMLHTVRSVFSATSAYLDSPGDKGFLPLSYFQPTLDVTSWPAVTYPNGIPLFINVRPAGNVRFTVNRDRQTPGKSTGERTTSMPWSVPLLAKDPRVYVDPEQSAGLSGGTVANVAGSAVNRGDYESPLNITLVVAAAPGVVGSFRITGLNGIDMTIKIENKANVIYRWFGDDRVLMTEDTSNGPDTAPLVLRMDLVSFATLQRRPMVPASINPPTRPFATTYHYWKTLGAGVLAAGSRLWWNEAFA